MPDVKSDALTGAPTSQYVDPIPTGAPAPSEIDDNATYVVAGEEISGKDLREGRLRHADYTRKTQTIASERQRYEAATQFLNLLETDPQGTLAQLAQHYGVPMSGNAPSPTQQQFAPEEVEEEDPRFSALQSQVSELTAFTEQQLEQQADAYLAQQMEKVYNTAERLGIEVDEEELYSFSFQNNFVDPLAAFLRLHAEDIPEASAKKAIADYTAKRGLPVSRGSLNQAQVQRVTPQQRPRSIAEAMERALEEHGVNDIGELPSLNTYRP